jgi:tripartite-type tricarboxylate transporter receptor subunit TctC
MVHVPYKGNAGVLADLMGGQLQVTLDNLTPYMPQVKAGKIRLLAVSPATRSPAVPDVPTIAEAGVPGYETLAWFGLVAPARTPRDIVDKLSAETARILKLPDVNQKLLEQSAEPVGNTPQEFDAFIKSEIAKWAKVIADAGVPGYETLAWFGLVAPAKTPRDIVEKLSAETARILKLPDVNQKLMEQSAEPVGNAPQEFDAFIKSEIAKWARVISDAKVELQ